MEPNDLEKKQVELLLANYNAIKTEIARRSQLQWLILGGQAYFLLNALQEVQRAMPDIRKGYAWVFAAWGCRC